MLKGSEINENGKKTGGSNITGFNNIMYDPSYSIGKRNDRLGLPISMATVSGSVPDPVWISLSLRMPIAVIS